MDLVTEAMEETTDMLLKKADEKRDGVIADTDLEGVFGIEMEDTATFDTVNLPKPSRSGRRGRRAAQKQKSMPAAAARKRTVADDRRRVLDLVTRSQKGIDVPSLKKKTGLDPIKIRNIIFSAYHKGVIVRVGRGLYKGKPTPMDPSKETETVLALIKKSPGGIGVPEIKDITHLPDARVRYIVSRAYVKGDIARVARGLYTAPKKTATPPSASDAVLLIIGKSRKGIGFPLLLEKSGLKEKQLRNIIFRLNKLNKIKRVRRGVYAATRKQ
jgi:predicted transcriptional regulator of viral defense system